MFINTFFRIPKSKPNPCEKNSFEVVLPASTSSKLDNLMFDLQPKSYVLLITDTFGNVHGKIQSVGSKD